MKKICYRAFFLLVITSNASAYQEPTHIELSEASVKRSVLNASNILGDFGLGSGVDSLQEFNNYIPKDVPHTVRRYIEAGSDFEDEGVRSLNHFYDPYNNIGLKSWIGYKSPDWALEDSELEKLPEQDFSLFHAEDYFYKALSLLDAKDRQTNFGKLFRTIGHVIHHVQDMAQPQHVRDDDHCGEVGCSAAEFLGVFHPSLYEELSNDDRDDLIFSGYGDVSFATAREFWHNGNWSGMADFTNQNFISAGTNFIVNNNGLFFTHPEYPEPKPLDENILPVRIEDTITDPALSGLTGWMEFIPTVVMDRNLTGTSATSVNDRASTLSIFDQDLELENACVQYSRTFNNDETKTYTFETCRLFTFNRFNVEEAQKYLIPRAVSYSTGLINHFFRGRLDITKIEKTADSLGNAVLAISVKNISSQNFAMSNGKLEVFYDAIVNGVEVRKPVQLVEGETGAVTEILNGAEMIIKFNKPTDVDPSKENPFVVVFKGNIGIDPGIAGKVFNTKGETAILLFYTNNNNLLVKRSIDQGRSWNAVNDPIFAGFDLFNGDHKGTKLLPSGEGKSLLVGRYGSNYVALRSTNNGKNWMVHLDQSFGEYTEVLNVVKAVHVGNGRLVSFNNYYSSSYTVGTRTYYKYDVELSESFDDGQTWSPMNIPFEVNGQASHLYYLGNQHMLLLTAGYDVGCNCSKRVWYESFNSGESFAPASFTTTDLEWNHGQWYRDAYAYDTEQVVTTKNISLDLSALVFKYALSNDGGKTLTITDTASKDVAWPQAEPIHIRPLGQGVFVSYVFDPWTAYERNLDSYYEGILISEDYGVTWKQVYQNTLLTWFDPYYNFMGVTTEDPEVLKYIH